MIAYITDEIVGICISAISLTCPVECRRLILIIRLNQIRAANSAEAVAKFVYTLQAVCRKDIRSVPVG